MDKKGRIFLTKESFIDSFRKLGIQKGMTLMVHTSLSRLGFVCGGAQTVIEALIAAVGSEGTILMPTQSWKNLDPTAGVHWEEPEEWWDLIRENWPAYDKRITPTNTMGAVAEMFRCWPGVLRSDHPARSIAAWGKYAEYLTENHDLSNIFGNGSPIEKLYRLNGYVLQLGVGYDKNTSLHLADVWAEYPNKRYTTEHSAMMINGKREWVAYETLVVEGEDFDRIGEEFEKDHLVATIQIGNGLARLIKQPELVDFAVQWIEKNRK